MKVDQEKLALIHVLDGQRKPVDLSNAYDVEALWVRLRGWLHLPVCAEVARYHRVIEAMREMVRPAYEWPQWLGLDHAVCRAIAATLMSRVELELPNAKRDYGGRHVRAMYRAILYTHLRRTADWPEPVVDPLHIEEQWRKLRCSPLWDHRAALDGCLDALQLAREELSEGRDLPPRVGLVGHLEVFVEGIARRMAMEWPEHAQHRVAADEVAPALLAIVVLPVLQVTRAHAEAAQPVSAYLDAIRDGLPNEPVWQRCRSEVISATRIAVADPQVLATIQQSRPPRGFTMELVRDVLVAWLDSMDTSDGVQ